MVDSKLRPDSFKRIYPDCCSNCDKPKFYNDYRSRRVGWFCTLHEFKFKDHLEFSNFKCDDHKRKREGGSGGG